MTRLTAEQWRAINTAFVWMRVEIELQPIRETIITKWLDRHVQGWWYMEADGKDRYLFVFENSSEMVAFKIWISDNPFERDHGEFT